MLDTVFLQILNMSFTASIVILFVLLARLLLKKVPKIFSYALWSVVLFRLCCPFSFDSIFSLLPVKSHSIPPNIGFMQVPQIDTGIPIINESINSILPAATPIASVNPLQIWIFSGRVLWLVGIAALLIYSVVSLLKLRCRLKDAVQESGNIYSSASLTSPFVMGLFRPKIYLPAHLTEEEKCYIILHEQTHIKRLDHVVKLASFFVLCLHWFNPLVWVAFFLCGRDMELSCDEAVIKKLGSEVKKDYSSSLLTLATGRKIVGGIPLAFGEGDTKSRIKNVLNYKKPAFWVIVVSVIAVVAVGIGLATNPKDNPILIPKSDEVASIRIEQINEGESLGVVETVDKNQIETLLKALQNTNKTLQESVNDSPNRNDYFQININGSDSKKFYLYSDREQYFIEEPYTGIYKTSRETSVSIAKLYTAAPFDYKPAIMINDQIYWLSTDANPDAPSGNTWLFGQIKKVSPQSAPPSENFEAIGLDSSYVGKNIYISPDGNTLYLDRIAGEKTLQFVFEETQTDLTEPSLFPPNIP